MEKVLKEKEAYKELLDYFSGLTDDDKKEILHSLMYNAFKELHMATDPMDDYMVHNIRTCEERYTIKEFSETLFKYFLMCVEGTIHIYAK